MKHYERPALKFVSLRNENTVANTCWGHAGTSQVLYCDIPGQGYCSFQISSANCSLDILTNVMYYEYNGAEAAGATAAQQSALKTVLIESGGSQGNPFRGEGTVVIVPPPDDPTPDLPDWS